MKLLERLSRALTGDAVEPAVLDHAPVPTGNPDWRAEKLKDAAARFNKPFKCGPDGLPRETLVEGKYVDASKAHKSARNVKALTVVDKKVAR